nr:glutathione synthase [Laribacter sp.]
MKVAFIADPLAGFKTYKDSTFAMMEAAAARGHQLFAAGLPDLFAREGRVYLRATPLTLTSQRDDWYRCGTPQDTDLTAFDAVVMRKDPPFDAEYLYATHLMSVAERLGARCFNRGQAIRDHNEKLAILGYPHLTATTLVSRDMDRLRAFVSEQGDAILKPLDSMGGEGIFRLSARDPNLGSVLEVMSQHGQRSLMVQRYLPQI